MRNETEEIIVDNYIETLEDIAFVFSDRIEQEEAKEKLEKDKKFYSSSMNFSGAVQGGIKLVAEKEFCRIIADNMLGGLENDSEELLMDGFKELTNVICGKLITEIVGKEPIVNLSIPEVEDIAKENIRGVFSETSLCFNSDEFLVVIQFEIEED